METFSTFVPFDILEKGNEEKAEPMTARIGGIISTESQDQQGEIIDQAGVDWNYFLKHGWFNYEHKQGPENILGHPELVAETDHEGKTATRVEGVLYLHKAKAKEVWETAMAMKKAGVKRKLGFSVEGQVIQRNQKQIKKARVLNVAITAHPVNPDARLEVLARSLGYQTPAQPDPDASLSPLVPQSMGASLPAKVPTLKNNRQGKISVAKLTQLLTQVFPELAFGKASDMARRIISVFQ